jgi:hypothetical protein
MLNHCPVDVQELFELGNGEMVGFDHFFQSGYSQPWVRHDNVRKVATINEVQ